MDRTALLASRTSKLCDGYHEQSSTNCHCGSYHFPGQPFRQKRQEGSLYHIPAVLQLLHISHCYWIIGWDGYSDCLFERWVQYMSTEKVSTRLTQDVSHDIMHSGSRHKTNACGCELCTQYAMPIASNETLKRPESRIMLWIFLSYV